MTKYNCLETDISDVFSVFILFFTPPETFVSVERSFGKLKFIKDYRGSSMRQSRLNDLSLMEIESTEAKKTDFKKFNK